MPRERAVGGERRRSRRRGRERERVEVRGRMLGVGWALEVWFLRRSTRKNGRNG